MYTLYARAGWGSALIETQLAWFVLTYRVEEIGDLHKDKGAGERLLPVNPLMQIPTLVLPDGQIMTESAAITLHFAEATGRNDLVPPPPRPQFLRWLVFLVANIYPTFTYADVPGRFVPDEDAQKAFEANVNAYARRLWEMMEAQAGAPWFLDARFTALDLFIAVMTKWRPRRAWFQTHTPRLHAIAAAAETAPEIAEVWRRNFPNGA
jgi:GST-like protein